MSIQLLRDYKTLLFTFPKPLNLKPLKRHGSPKNIGVPRIIWRTWKDDSWRAYCVSAIQLTSKTMSNWQQRVYNDAQCEQFIRKVYHDYPEILEAWNLCNIGVMKADLWRYLVIYWYGGLYLDMKSAVARTIEFTQPPSLSTCPRLWTSPWKYKEGSEPYHHHLFPYGEMQQFWIAAEPESPALWHVICQVTANIIHVAREKPKIPPFLELPKVASIKSQVLSCTGPIPYTYAIAEAAMTYANSVVILQENCAECISYFPPNPNELPQKLNSHYSNHPGPLTK